MYNLSEVFLRETEQIDKILVLRNNGRDLRARVGQFIRRSGCLVDIICLDMKKAMVKYSENRKIIKEAFPYIRELTKISATALIKSSGVVSVAWESG